MSRSKLKRSSSGSIVLSPRRAEHASQRQVVSPSGRDHTEADQYIESDVSGMDGDAQGSRAGEQKTPTGNREIVLAEPAVDGADKRQRQAHEDNGTGKPAPA